MSFRAGRRARLATLHAQRARLGANDERRGGMNTEKRWSGRMLVVGCVDDRIAAQGQPRGDSFDARQAIGVVKTSGPSPARTRRREPGSERAASITRAT
jgi:hypothetical protein